MLKAIFNFFKKPVAPVAETPYKVETPVVEDKKPAKTAKKKPSVKKATTRKPREKKTTN